MVTLMAKPKHRPDIDLTLIAGYFLDQLDGEINGEIGVREREVLPDQIMFALPCNHLVSVVPEIDIPATNRKIREGIERAEDFLEGVTEATEGLTSNGFVPKRGEYEVAAFTPEGKYVEDVTGAKVLRRQDANEVVQVVIDVHDYAEP